MRTVGRNFVRVIVAVGAASMLAGCSGLSAGRSHSGSVAAPSSPAMVSNPAVSSSVRSRPVPVVSPSSPARAGSTPASPTPGSMPVGGGPVPFFPVPGPRPGQSPVVPAGQRVVTFHGLAVTVPAAWTANDTQCGEPVHPTVITRGESNACLLGHLPLVDSVRFLLTPGGAASQTKGIEDTVTTIRIPGAAITATESATATQQTSAPGAIPFRIKVYLPALHVGALVIGTDERRARALGATLRTTEYDTGGCASTVPSTATLPTGGPPAYPGAEQQLIPGRPAAILICRYFAGGFERGATIAPARIAAFVVTINGSPPGLSRSKNPAAPYCRPVDHPPARLTVDAQTDQTGWLTANYLVVVRYPGGSAISLLSRWAFCGDLGITNGTIAGQRTVSLLTALAVAGDSPAEPDVQPK